ncbi:MFS general substrate transporter [Vararia minispora EC-137]|uniref:MFS general substrate transporter n=1 Tax=Vararia minispora EC-137 TaxID=1314806 RepID=A0ACB8QFM2_9AGAM|nr:MFS general substrate transporter [Vararia minispora EC-137]
MNRASLQDEQSGSSSVTVHSERPSDFNEHNSPSPTPVAPALLSWDGPDDAGNPRNWAKRRRWTVTLVVSLFTFISPVASSISSPSLPAISAHFNIPPGSILESMSLSIFVLAYAIGPLFWGPLSELYGRLIILQSSNLFFLLFNTACAFSKNVTQLLVFRFLAGLGGAAPQSVGGAVVGDLWAPEECGSAMAVYSLAPLVGPATGPLVGGWIAEKSRWQWVFWSVSIADAVLQVVAFLTIRETYGPEILRRRMRKMRKAGPDTEKAKDMIIVPSAHQSIGEVMFRGLVRPFVFLVTEPIVQVFALYMAVLYGLLYLTLVHFVDVYTDQYGETDGIAGMHYLSIALGSTVGGQIGARALNYLYRVLKAKNNGVGTPEMRLPLLMATATTLPIGLLIYGWSVQAHAHWIVPDIGVFIFSIGIGGNWTCIQTYLVDSYAIFAASAIAGVTSFRAFAGFGFPLFQDKLYGCLGDGWGNSLLALICLAIGCPAPFIFYRYGPVLREKGKGGAK